MYRSATRDFYMMSLRDCKWAVCPEAASTRLVWDAALPRLNVMILVPTHLVESTPNKKCRYL